MDPNLRKLLGHQDQESRVLTVALRAQLHLNRTSISPILTLEPLHRSLVRHLPAYLRIIGESEML